MEQMEHRAFLNRYYGFSKYVYDITRKYYLFGRDKVIDQVLGNNWNELVEIGSGTGRNLRKIQKKYPNAKLGGVELSDEMISYAKNHSNGIHYVQGYAESVDYRMLLGKPPQIILFSYSLSMIRQGRIAIEHALDMLDEHGEIVIVDFSDLSGLSYLNKKILRKWLDLFHVKPIQMSLFEGMNVEVEYCPYHYYVIIRIFK